MQKNESQESVDAIRQILFGQEKRVLEDSIAEISAKFNALAERLSQFEQGQSYNLELSNKGLEELQNKVAQVEYKASGFQKEQTVVLQKVKEQLKADLDASATDNKKMLSELSKGLTEKETGFKQLLQELESNLNEKLVSKSQVAAAFHAIAVHFEK